MPVSPEQYALHRSFHGYSTENRIAKCNDEDVFACVVIDANRSALNQREKDLHRIRVYIASRILLLAVQTLS
jgi:hypothetical protein